MQKINEGILNKNPDLIISAGKKSCGSVIVHARKGMMKALPSGFKKLVFSTHALFDKIAKDAENNLLHNCTTCHQNYKIVASKN